MPHCTAYRRSELTLLNPSGSGRVSSPSGAHQRCHNGPVVPPKRSSRDFPREQPGSDGDCGGNDTDNAAQPYLPRLAVVGRQRHGGNSPVKASEREKDEGLTESMAGFHGP